MKYIWAILIIGLLAFSTISFVASASKVRCPTCDGTGEIDCPYCDGTGVVSGDAITSCSHCSGTGKLTPRIYMVTLDFVGQGDALNVSATFKNMETFDATATVTASIYGDQATSPEINFPANQTIVPVNILITQTTINSRGLSSNQILSQLQAKANAAEMTCPYCDGTGSIGDSTTCPDCDGTGKIECPDCGGTGRVDESQLAAIGGVDISGGSDFSLIAWSVAVAAVVGVGGTSFFMLKKRHVSEKSLRRMSSSEFQRWVIKKLGGKDATSSDLSMGIDGFSRSGEPISIKQSDSVDMLTIDRFASALAKNCQRSGTIVAFGFGADAIRGKVRARTNYRVDIQMVTVQELMFRK
jgi:hypothetical protein